MGCLSLPGHFHGDTAVQGWLFLELGLRALTLLGHPWGGGGSTADNSRLELQGLPVATAMQHLPDGALGFLFQGGPSRAAMAPRCWRQ